MQLLTLPPRGRRARSSLVLALVAAFAIAAPASAQPPQLLAWHRVNTDPANPAPEHERLQCLPGVQWVCRYDKLPEPELEFGWNRTIAMFHGREVADPDCPEWLDTICGEEAVVIGGVANFSQTGGGAFRAAQQLIFPDSGAVAPLYIHWVDLGFACPWYGSFADALDANPWLTQDCRFAP